MPCDLLIRNGVVVDPDTVGPEMPEVVHDLPAGARGIQCARGIAATIVNGEVLVRDGEHTSALRLLRGPLARPA